MYEYRTEGLDGTVSTFVNESIVCCHGFSALSQHFLSTLLWTSDIQHDCVIGPSRAKQTRPTAGSGFGPKLAFLDRSEIWLWRKKT